MDLLEFNLGGTYITNYEVSITPTAPLLDQRNLIFRPLKFKARASVAWTHGPVNARLLATHVGGYTNDAIVPNQSVESFTPVDLFLAYNFGEDGSWNPFGANLTVGIEVRNVFDEDPPYVNIAPTGNGSGGYDATAASPIGRIFAASARIKF
jgi:iron complex outermembrane receptor protein